MTDTHTGSSYSIHRSVFRITPDILLQTIVASPCMKEKFVLILISLVMTVLFAGVQAEADVDWNNAGAYLAGKDNPQKTIEEYNAEIAHMRQLEAAGWVLKNPLQYHDTLSFCENAIQKDSENPKMWYNKASVLIRMGRYETALEAINKAIQIDPEYAHAWSKKGILLNKMGRKQEADAAYTRAKVLENE